MTEHEPREDRQPEHQTDQQPEREPFRPRPGIWVAPDADALSGWWYDATGTTEQVAKRIGSGKIFDTVDFGDFTVHPDDTADIIATVANGIREHGYAYASWAQLHDAEPDMLASFSEHYLGHFASYQALGDELHGSGITLPGTSDQADPGLELTTLEAPNGGVYLFRGPT